MGVGNRGFRPLHSLNLAFASYFAEIVLCMYLMVIFNIVLDFMYMYIYLLHLILFISYIAIQITTIQISNKIDLLYTTIVIYIYID